MVILLNIILLRGFSKDRIFYIVFFLFGNSIPGVFYVKKRVFCRRGDGKDRISYIVFVLFVNCNLAVFIPIEVFFSSSHSLILIY